MTCELAVADFAGRTVDLHHRNWQKHLTRHPDMEQQHGRLPRVLQEPEQHIYDANTFFEEHFYRKYYDPFTGRKRWLHVVVAYEGGGRQGAIKSAHFVDTLKPKGQVLWNPPPQP